MRDDNVPTGRAGSTDPGQEWLRATERLAERLAARQGARLYSAIALLFLLALLFRFFDVVSRVALIAFVGAILALAFHSVVVRIPLRRGLATMVVAATTLGVIGLGVWQGVAALLPQLRSLALDLPRVEAKIEAWQAQLRQRTGLELDLLGGPLERLLQDPADLGLTLLTRAFGILEILGIVILVLAGSIYVVAKPNEQLLDPVMRTIPRERQPAFRRMMKLMAHRLGGWIRGTLLSMLIIGTLSGFAFWLLGAPYPLLLGVLAGTFELIPVLGPWIGGALAVLVTLFYEPQTALYVAFAVLVIQQVEGYLVYPFVMSGAASIHPFVTLLSLLLFGAIFGILGALLALPLTLAIGTAVEVLWVEERLGNYRAPDKPLVDT